jgi:uncharacterized protein (TIGR02246 family)
MLKQMTFTLVALAGIIVAAPRHAWGQLSDADKKGIQDVTDRWLKAMENNDSTAVAALYTEDAMLLPPNAPMVKGRAAIRHFLGQFPKITSFKAPLVEIAGSGNLAYTRGTYEVTLMPPGAKTPVKDSGKFIEIRQKEPDGSWLIQRDFWNSDVAPGK